MAAIAWAFGAGVLLSVALACAQEGNAWGSMILTLSMCGYAAVAISQQRKLVAAGKKGVA